jgi:hypothetical protein
MRPTEAINVVETVLRDLIREVIGDAWQSDPSINLQKLEENKANEIGGRRGAIVSNDLLDFAEFLQVRSIIDNQWNHFAQVLKNRDYFNQCMSRLGVFRNPSMHSRDLLPFEEALVIGMTGEIRNLVTKWRSTKGPDMKYYPEITLITDSLGNRLSSGQHTGSKLRPGQTISFKCIGTDPEGRELSWELRVTSKGGSMIMLDGAKGDDVTLTWHVEEQHVRDGAYINIQMSSSGKYHRDGEIDAQFTSRYDVLPPLR